MDKANRAWFAISNVLYLHKRLPVGKGFNLFDSLIRPIATFSCEAWLPLVLPKASFNSRQSLLKTWETLKCELLNQKLCRMLLSVHKRTHSLLKSLVSIRLFCNWFTPIGRLCGETDTAQRFKMWGPNCVMFVCWDHPHWQTQQGDFISY